MVPVKLSKVIRDELVARQLSQSVFARILGVSSPTLRTWMYRNCFPKIAVKLIIHEFKWQCSEDEIKSRYAFDWARPTPQSQLAGAGSLRSAFIVADRERERVAAAMAPMSEIVVKLCSAMGKEDLLTVLTATVTPWEMERHVGKEMKDAIIEGVRNGGTFLYLRARQSLVDKYFKHPWKFDRILTEEKCKAEIDSFREEIEERLRADGMSTEDAKDRAIRSTPQYHVQDDLPFLVPGFVIMMFRSGGHPGHEEDRLVVRLPDNPWAAVYLTRADYFHDRFRRTVCQALSAESMRIEDELKRLEKTRRRSERAVLEREREVLGNVRRILDPEQLG